VLYSVMSQAAVLNASHVEGVVLGAGGVDGWNSVVVVVVGTGVVVGGVVVGVVVVVVVVGTGVVGVVVSSSPP